jgi:hypothetical protein
MFDTPKNSIAFAHPGNESPRAPGIETCDERFSIDPIV